MASDDIYLRKDVYEADQRAAKAENRLGNEEILKELRLFREEINGKIADFREEVNGRFSKLEAKVEVLTGRVDGIERRIDKIEGNVSTGIAFIAMLITTVVFIEPIARFVRKIFKSEQTVTIEQVEALIDSKLQPKQ